MYSTISFHLTLMILKSVSSGNEINNLSAGASREHLNGPDDTQVSTAKYDNLNGPTVHNIELHGPEETHTENTKLNPEKLQADIHLNGSDVSIAQNIQPNASDMAIAQNIPLNGPEADNPFKLGPTYTALNEPAPFASKEAREKLLAQVYSPVNYEEPLPQSYYPTPLAEESNLNWPVGVVRYYIDKEVYDEITMNQIHKAMHVIEAVSCVVFVELDKAPSDDSKKKWLHITNPDQERECVHFVPELVLDRKIPLILGFDCLRTEEIVHTLLHGIGLRDEITHPHRDQYVRILWENIQPKYRALFGIQHNNPPHKTVEYDPSSIMHFHDRAFSSNGAPTITPLLPGMHLRPSNTLSQLDIMKLQLLFGHGCKKRQISELFDTCKNAFHDNGAASDGKDDGVQPVNLFSSRDGDSSQMNDYSAHEGTEDDQHLYHSSEANEHAEHIQAKLVAGGQDHSTDTDGNDHSSNSNEESVSGDESGEDVSESQSIPRRRSSRRRTNRILRKGGRRG